MKAVANIFSPTRTSVIQSRSARIVLATGALTILMALGATARIPLPFTPVPFTMQVFFIFFGAMALGKRSTISMTAYLGLGALGLPVFSGYAGGLAALAGPTGGYLFGFILCALIIGATIPRFERPSLKRDALFLGLGMMCYYIPGILWLKILTGSSMTSAFLWGFVPFIVNDMAKAAIAYGLYKASRKRLTELFD